LFFVQPDHPDYPDVLYALEEMRRVAHGVNESRRRREELEALVRWQYGSVASWEGPPVWRTCSLMLHQGEVFALKGSSSPAGQKPKELVLFLFDHLLVYCRKVS
jgi:hypothetical protein